MRRRRTCWCRRCRLAVAHVVERAVQVRGPKSEQSAADGQAAFEDVVSGRWYIGDDLTELVRGIGGCQIELGLPGDPVFGVGAGRETQQPNHCGSDKYGCGKVGQFGLQLCVAGVAE